MQLEEFKKLYERFTALPPEEAEKQEQEYDAFIEAINSSEECSNWYLQQQLEKRHFDYSTYCCLEMASHVAEGIDAEGEEIYDNPEVIMRRWDDLFGIPVHNGSGGMITINFCPWCGTRLGS